MPQTYQVTAIPYDGVDYYYAANHRFGKEPITVTVLDDDTAPEERKPYELTPSELAILRSKERIKVEGGGSSASSTAASAAEEDADTPQRSRRR